MSLGKIDLKQFSKKRAIEEETYQKYENNKICDKMINPLKGINEVSIKNWESMNVDMLLNGKVLFSYNNYTKYPGIINLTVVQNEEDDFTVSMVTVGEAAFIPHVDKKYLKTTLLDKLNDYTSEEIIIAFEDIISKL